MRPGEFLLYTLTPAPGGLGVWVFGKGKPAALKSSAFTAPPYKWQFGGKSSEEGLPHIPLSSSGVYILDLQFSGTPTYNLLVVKQPGDEKIQQISYTSQLKDDPSRPDTTANFPEPLDITFVGDEI
jgi:hypothetical protein